MPVGSCKVLAKKGMEMQKQSLSTSITTTTTIGPHIQQALKLLQLSGLELLDRIDAELAENPFLEVKSEESDGESQPEVNTNQEEDYSPIDRRLDDNSRREDAGSDSNIEEIFEDSSDFGYMKKSYDGSDANSKQLFLENAVAVPMSLYDHLLKQLSLLEVEDETYRLAEAIISSVDADGYFKIPLEEFALSVNAKEASVLKALQLVQSFEPHGIAARNLQECLLIQISNLNEPNKLVEIIIRDHFKLLEKKKYRELASRLNITENDLKECLKVISNLEPIPARQFDTKKIKYIVPDIIVQKVDGGFSIAVNDDYIPPLKINKFYRKVLKTEKMANEVKTFLSTKYNDARLLILSINKRKSTIYLVMEKILEMQQDFFHFGPHHLKPLTLNDVAEEVGMHMSTISRVTRDKYVDTPWGIFELKYFFSNSIKKEGGGIKAAQSVKEIIKQIIENEGGNKKLSDQKIADILSNQGITIARRTVAKYRRKLKILSSYDRKD